MNLLIVGTGGLAREFTTFFADTIESLGYLSNTREEFHQYGLSGDIFVNPDDAIKGGFTDAVIAIGNTNAKKRITNELRAFGFNFPNFVHETSVIARSAELAQGIVISPQCVVGPNVKIGEFCYLNFQVGIGHDTILNPFCQLNPGAQVGGTTTIEEGVLIGSNSTILQEKRIAAGSTIASGSTVMSSIQKSRTMIGIPARPLKFDVSL